MGHLSLFTFIIFIGLSMVIAKSEVKFRHHQQKRFARNNEPARTLRNLIGNLIDTEANIVYTIDGQKQVNTPVHSDATTTTVSPLAAVSAPKQEEMACLAACHSCLQGFSFHQKRDDDNCGPMCDCADRCFFMPAEQVGNMYNQISSIRNGPDCWWRNYNEFFANTK
ncbi:hypothetical protein I4U23_007674 [Adineta vaga]|nr:hypothetical protein I4U23_007674 [Adineta vaga]